MSEYSPNSLVTLQPKKKSALWLNLRAQTRLQKIKCAASLYGHFELKRMYYSISYIVHLVNVRFHYIFIQINGKYLSLQ